MRPPEPSPAGLSEGVAVNDPVLLGHLAYPVRPGPLAVRGIRVMHGANYFSGGPVLVFRLDLGAYDEVFTHQIPGFHQRLKRLLPSLVEHHCSPGVRGGFLRRVREGTLLGHVTEHVAIELQTLAGMDVAYGKTRSTTEPGVYNVVFRYFDELAGLYAGKAAVNLVNAVVEEETFRVEAALQALVEIRERRMLGPSTQAIVDEAARRGIPALRLDAYNLVQLGTGRHHKWVRATITSDTSALAVDTAGDKHLTWRILTDAGVPVPETLLTADLGEVLAFWRTLGAPLVLKPRQGAAGRGVSLDLDDEARLARAFQRAGAHGEQVLAQRQATGRTFRLLVVDYRLEAAAELEPPRVVGDGVHTLHELVERLNDDPRRGVGDKALLTRVELDELTAVLLEDHGLSPSSVLPEGETLALKVSGSLRLGGSAVDVTDRVHPMNRFLAERAARVIGLNVAGVDVVAGDIGRSILDSGGVVVEVNAAPDFRPHLRPTGGEPRDVARPLVGMLFPNGARARVPVFSVTGTLGKTTTVRLLAHCLREAGFVTGVTCTEGLYVADRRLQRGDMTYPEQVGLVLKDPTIDCAVLETSREGILRRGLGYELADVGVVLNLHDDHVGDDDITLLEDLAYAKSVVAEQVYPDGYAVLNADQALVLEMEERVAGRLALFSADPANPRLREHCDGGGLAAVLDRGQVVLLAGRARLEVAPLEDLPLSLGGKARCNLDNLLAAAVALFAHGLPLELIRGGLETFRPDPEMLPGRMNLIACGGGEVLVDYAHNRASFALLADYLARRPERKVAALDAPGDRSDEEIAALGALAAAACDELCLFEDPDRRGRAPGEITDLLARGAATSGLPPERVRTFAAAEAAWAAALAERGPRHPGRDLDRAERGRARGVQGGWVAAGEAAGRAHIVGRVGDVCPSVCFKRAVERRPSA